MHTPLVSLQQELRAKFSAGIETTISSVYIELLLLASAETFVTKAEVQRYVFIFPNCIVNVWTLFLSLCQCTGRSLIRCLHDFTELLEHASGELRWVPFR